MSLRSLARSRVVLAVVVVLVLGGAAVGVAAADVDGDGMPNYAEVTAGTAPLDADTDGDGVLDGTERSGGTDPLAVDANGDGIPDAVVHEYDLDPDWRYPARFAEVLGTLDREDDRHARRFVESVLDERRELRPAGERLVESVVDLDASRRVRSLEWAIADGSVREHAPEQLEAVAELDDAGRDWVFETDSVGDTDWDGDYLENWIEIDELRTDPREPNPDLGTVARHADGENALELVEHLERNPRNIAPQILQVGVYEDGEVTDEKLARMRDGDDDGLIGALDPDDADPDIDKDGIPDGAERFGFRRLGDDADYPGVSGEQLDPRHDDAILVAVTGRPPAFGADAEAAARSLFAGFPTSNPEGSSGVALHWREFRPDLSNRSRFDGVPKNTSIGLERSIVESLRRDPRYGFAKFAITAETTDLWGLSPRGRSYFFVNTSGIAESNRAGDHVVAEMIGHEWAHSAGGKLPRSVRQSDDPYHATNENALMHPDDWDGNKYMTDPVGDMLTDQGFTIHARSVSWEVYYPDR